MTTQPCQGTRYRYTGKDPMYRAYEGRVGVASAVTQASTRAWYVALSNQREWADLPHGPVISVMNHEIEPVTDEPTANPKVSKRGNTPADAYDGLEADLVSEILKALAAHGFDTCAVGQRKAQGSGTTVGYPDLSVRRPDWPQGMVCLIEVKTKTGALEPEQEALHRAGWSFVAWSVAGAIEALETFEREVGIEEVGA